METLGDSQTSLTLNTYSYVLPVFEAEVTTPKRTPRSNHPVPLAGIANRLRTGANQVPLSTKTI